MIPRSDPFYSAKTSLAEAEDYRVRLEKTIQAFLEGKPFSTKIEASTDGEWLEQKVYLTEPFPPELEKLAKNLVRCSREALDQAMTAVCRPNALPYFPIASTREGYEKKIRELSEKKGCPDRIIQVIEQYEGMYYDRTNRDGNFLIWALNELCNENKHGIITPIPIKVGKRKWHFLNQASDLPVQLGISSEWDWDKNETIIGRMHPEADVSFAADFEMGFEVVCKRAGLRHPTDILSCMYWLSSNIAESMEKAFNA